jgi:hypothetical protein
MEIVYKHWNTDLVGKAGALVFSSQEKLYPEIA